MFISPGDSRRTTFQMAVELYRNRTCIEWVEVGRNETPGYVQVLDSNKGCSSYEGLLRKGINNITLDSTCNLVRNMFKTNIFPQFLSFKNKGENHAS